MQSFGLFIHPVSRQKIVGFRLGAGDTTRPDDVYSSTVGVWEKVPPKPFTFSLNPPDDVFCVRPLW